MDIRTSLRQISEFLDERDRTISITRAIARHRGISNTFRAAVARHSSRTRVELSLLWYNTWLLRPIAGIIAGAPLVGLRSYLIGREIQATGYDIAALCEVFDADSQDAVSLNSALPYKEVGPVATGVKKSSGLLTLSRYPLQRTSRRRFVDSGSGPDYWTNKGVLFSRIDLAIGAIDLYTTHLSWGKKCHTLERRSNERMGQLDEITTFISETHDPENVVMLIGDMNINAAPRPSEYDGGAYRNMCNKLASITLSNGTRIGLTDLWPFAGGRKGATNYMYMNCQDEDRLVEHGRDYCDDDLVSNIEDEGRIDYIFVQEPTDTHRINVDFTRMKRRPFPVPHLTFQEAMSTLPTTQRSIIEHLLDTDFGRAVALLQRSGLLPALSVPRSRDDLAAAVNDNIRQQLKQHETDPYGHLSDHLGLEVTLLASSR